MYDFIFFIMYNYQLEKGSSVAYAKFNATIILAFAIGLQCMDVIVIGKFFFDNTLVVSKVFSIILLTCLYIAIYYYYDDNRIEIKASAITYKPTVFRKLLVFCVIVACIVFVAVLSTK